MCGRFSLDRSAEILEARFKAKLRIQNAVLPMYNIGPGMKSAVITMEDPSGINIMPWGLAENSKDGKARNLINARTETFTAKWPFAALSSKQRCLVPATGYIEWKAIGHLKIPFLIRLKSNEVFSFAGLYEDHGEQRRFTILTMPAGPVAAQVHDRMPVILTQEKEEKWLSPDSNPEELGTEFLRQKEAELESFSISPKLNRSFENNPELIQPCPYAVPVQLNLF